MKSKDVPPHRHSKGVLDTLFRQGDFVRFIQFSQEQMAFLIDRVGYNSMSVAFAMREVAIGLEIVRNLESALDLYIESARLISALRSKYNDAYISRLLDIARVLGKVRELDEAEAICLGAYQLTIASGETRADRRTQMTIMLASAARLRGDFELAEHYLGPLYVPKEVIDHRIEHQKALLALATGDLKAAQHHLVNAVQSGGMSRNGASYYELARLLAKNGDDSSAHEMLTRARQAFEATSPVNVEAVHKCDELLLQWALEQGPDTQRDTTQKPPE